jgi:hypothetical protein
VPTSFPRVGSFDHAGSPGHELFFTEAKGLADGGPTARGLDDQLEHLLPDLGRRLVAGGNGQTLPLILTSRLSI